MTPVEQLHKRLDTLGLKAIDARLEASLEQAAKAEPAYADFLLDVRTALTESSLSRALISPLRGTKTACGANS